MKKFHYAAGLLTLAMLGACSSEAPDTTPTGEELTGDVSYVALHITSPGITRADEAVEASDAESKINSVSLYILSKTGDSYNVIRRLSSSAISDAGDIAYFPVTSYVFEDLKNYTATGNKKVILKVYANRSTDLSTVFTDDEAKEVYSGNTWSSGNFLMTNTTETAAFLSAPGEGKDGKTQENAWVINGGATNEQLTVTLERLCSRFDLENYTGITNGVYTATGDGCSDLQITLEGIAIHTHENSAYWFQQADKNTPNSLFNNGICSVTGGGKVSFTNDAHSYDLTLPSEADGVSTVYAHPHTIASSITSMTGYTIGYAHGAYAAIKCSFTHKDIPAKADKVYSHNGYFLGTFTQFTDNTLKDLYARYPQSEQDWITATQKSSSLTEDSFKQVTIEYTKEGNKFYTYYNVLLTNVDGIDTKAKRTRENTMILRNTCYKLSVASIKNLGYNGADTPHDEVEDQMLYIDMNIKVKDWVKNTANTELEL